MPDVEIKALPAQEALRFFRSKNIGGRFAFNWQDVEREEHAASFVVAKAMRADILQVFHGEIERVLADGGTIQQAIQNVRPELERKGWWNRRQRRDPVTGESGEVQLGSPRRLRTIFNTNLRTARAAGRWERIQRRKESLGFLIYVDAGDGRVRHQHHLWNGIILPVDHPFWNQYYPPNDFGCRCIVRQVSAKWLERRGLTVTSEAKLSSLGYGRTDNFTNPRTGQSRKVPNGIRPGFDYNVGQQRLRPLSLVPDGAPISETSEAWVAGASAKEYPLAKVIDDEDLLPDDISSQDAVRIFMDEFEGPLFHDAAQVPLLIDESFFGDDLDKALRSNRKIYLKLLAQTIKDPEEIWVSTEISRNTGETLFRRRYLSSYILKGSDKPFIVVMEEDGDSWRGVTSFVGRNPNNAARQVRTGTLIYKRN